MTPPQQEAGGVGIGRHLLAWPEYSPLWWGLTAWFCRWEAGSRSWDTGPGDQHLQACHARPRSGQGGGSLAREGHQTWPLLSCLEWGPFLWFCDRFSLHYYNPSHGFWVSGMVLQLHIQWQCQCSVFPGSFFCLLILPIVHFHYRVSHYFQT